MLSKHLPTLRVLLLLACFNTVAAAASDDELSALLDQLGLTGAAAQADRTIALVVEAKTRQLGLTEPQAAALQTALTTHSGSRVLREAVLAYMQQNVTADQRVALAARLQQPPLNRLLALARQPLPVATVAAGQTLPPGRETLLRALDQALMSSTLAAQIQQGLATTADALLARQLPPEQAGRLAAISPDQRRQQLQQRQQYLADQLLRWQQQACRTLSDADLQAALDQVQTPVVADTLALGQKAIAQGLTTGRALSLQ